MGESIRHIRQVRIDVPLRATSAYLFVDEEHAGWHPWWRSLYDYLLAFAPVTMEWVREPVQNVYVARPKLTSAQCRQLWTFLRTAPVQEIETHRTLERAVKLNIADVERLRLAYFSG